MAWYRSGSISVTNGSTAVTGSGTAWIANVSAGESLYAPDGKQYEIASINSDTTLTLATAYLGSNQTGQSYFVIPTQSYLRDLAGQAAALVNSYSSYNTTSLVGKFNDGTLTSPGISFSSDQDTGFRRTGSGTFAITNNGTDTVSFAPTGAAFTGDLSVSGKITAAINGAIGATTPNTGAFTTLTTTGNVTLGDAATDTVTVNGYMGVGGAANSARGLLVTSSVMTGATQIGFDSSVTGSTTGTTLLAAVNGTPNTVASVYTVADVVGLRAGEVTKGAGSTITNKHGVYISDQTQGTNNFGITSVVSSGTNKWNIYASGTAANYLAGDVLVGTTTNTNTSKVVSSGTISETVGGTQYLVASQSDIGTAPNEIPLNGMLGSMAYQDSGSTVISGGVINNAPIGATTPNTGSFTTLTTSGNTTLGDASTDTVTVNGSMGVGGAASSNVGLYELHSTLTGVSQYGIVAEVTGTSAATTQINAISASPRTAAAAFTAGNVRGLVVNNANKGAGSTITDQTGILINDQTQGTNNYGVNSLVSSGTNKWNIYASGTAANYFAGFTKFGTVGTPSVPLDVEVLSGANTATRGLWVKTADLGGATGNAGVYLSVPYASGTTNEAFFRVKRGTGNVYNGAEIAFSYAFRFLGSLTEDTSERLRIDSAGNVLVTGVGGLGYGTGSGGAVTQATSRTTGVTLNKTNGAITLFTAAGSTTATTFTVTNSTVAATDVVHVCQKSGTNLYNVLVTAVAAGSFNITFYTTGGTASDAPVFNFTVIKAVTA